MTRSTATGILVLGIVAAGCSSPTEAVATGDDANLNEAPKPRAGNTIQSPSVDPNKEYWGSRDIALLEKVGALTRAEAQVAMRADGIIANNPPNNRIGVDELAVLESPERMRTLFPEEQAVIPKLWQILAIDPAPTYPSETPTLRPQAFDGYATAPTQMQTTDPVAKRIQLTFNSDGNAGTLSGLDVERAYGDRASYLPTEVATFRVLVASIAKQGTKIPAEAQRLVVPPIPSRVLHDFGGAKILVETGMAIQTAWYSNAGTLPVVGAYPVARAEIQDAGTKMILLSRTSGEERELVTGGTVAQVVPGVDETARVERWKDGKRSAQIDVGRPKSATAAIPFGYSVDIGEAHFDMVFQPSGGYDARGVYVARDSNFASAATIPSGSYYISGRPGDRVDVFANGRAVVYAGGVAKNCHPKTFDGATTVDGKSTTFVRTCVVLSHDRVVQETVTFGPHPAPSDSPAIGWSTASDGKTFDLYPL